ncbi:MAG: Loki-CTERM sorting domain-containing protein [Promethearchaeota archaeon]
MSTGFGYSNGGVHLNEVIRQRNAMGVIQFFPWGWNDINTTYTPAEDVFQTMWCSETTTEVGEDYWPDPEDERTGIPGYSMYVLLGVVAATIVAIIKKRK